MSRLRTIGWWFLSVLAGAIVCLGILAGFSFGLILLAAAGWIAVVVAVFAPSSTKFGMGIGVAAVFVVVAAMHVGETQQCAGERTFQQGNTTITEVTATDTTQQCDSGPGPLP